jgi:hypothetical protein
VPLKLHGFFPPKQKRGSHVRRPRLYKYTKQ